ncbi:MAG: bile acid:sodium symporter family protein [Kiritimatiellae bacterium]|nr:bile acid:sodium symporter family protein [Kiritimatiellia bacterium]
MSVRSFLNAVPEWITRYMAVLILLVAVVSVVVPGPVRMVVKTTCVPALLGVVMFGMGLTLRARDFALVLSRPFDVVIGVVAQFTVMPLVAFLLAKAMRLPDDLALGVVLVGACPGGTASNVIAFLARGDVALSVTMTSCSTLLAPLLTPLLVLLFAGRAVDVPAARMFLSILKIVIAPICAGVILNRYCASLAERAKRFMPALSSVVIAVIVAAVVASGAERIRDCLGLVAAVVILHNLAGFALGYGAGRLFRMNPAKCRTVAIEVGMQNSGLAASLAATHFAAFPLAGVPGALFSVWHNLSGALLAAWFSRRNTPSAIHSSPP